MDNRNFWIFSSRLVEWFYKGLSFSFKLLGLCFLIYILKGCFYLAPEERDFVHKVESAFQATDETQIKISDVTDFEWDTVCGFGSYNYPDALMTIFARYFMRKPFPEDALTAFANATGFDVSVFEGHVPQDGWLNFMGAHFFFKDGEVVRKYVYTKWYIFIYTGNDTLYFTHEHVLKNEICHERENAVFFYEAQSPYMILANKKDIVGDN